MSKYIDADKLISEIKIIQKSLESIDVRLNHARKIRTECLKEFSKCIIDVITSLQQEQPEVELEKAARNVYESWSGGTMDDVRRDMAELGKVLNARKEEK